MKANELRIGNYVYREWEKMVKQKEGERKSLYQIENVNLQSAKKYDPIPLTEEWLLKFGFHPNSSDIFENIEMPYYVKKGVCLFYNEGDLNNLYAGYGEMRQGKYYATQSIWIKSVHQLQNIHFALTGEELTIK